MVGLLRSFTVNTFDPNDPPGQTLCGMINQRGVATEILVHDLLEELAEIRASLRQELTIGLGQVAEELENRGGCSNAGGPGASSTGHPRSRSTRATSAPSRPGWPRRDPTCTSRWSPSTASRTCSASGPALLGLLDEEQQRLARALQLRSDLTRQFWAKIATFGRGGRWPLEDVPWRTTDGARVRLLLGPAHLDRHRGRGQRPDRRRRRRADREPARGAGQPRPGHPQADGGRPGDRPPHPGHAAAADRQREGRRGAPAGVDGLQLHLAGAQAGAQGGAAARGQLRPDQVPRSRRPDLGAHRAPPDRSGERARPVG